MVYEDEKDELEMFASEWILENPYVVFGDCGLLGDYVNKSNIKYIVDNDSSKWGTIINNSIKIKDPKCLLNEDKDIKIIIANRWNTSISNISKQLIGMGFKMNVNFSNHKKILSQWKWKHENKLMIPYTEYLVTTRCTLKCKNCILFIPLHKNSEDLSFEKMKCDIDAYFNFVDEVGIFRILGGEPFLNPNLGAFLEYICQCYRDKIGTLEIVTNGTVVNFDFHVLELCVKYNVKIHISNYTQAIDYQEVLKRFINLLECKKIKYENAFPDRWSWKAVNKPNIKIDRNTEQLCKLFQNCATHCRCLKDGKLYFCSMHSSALASERFSVADSGDYIDLYNDDKDIYRALKFDFGNINKGYISFCENCYGIGSHNNCFVIPGEQVGE